MEDTMLRYLSYEKQGSSDTNDMYGSVVAINPNYTIRVALQITDASGTPVYIDNVVCQNNYVPKLNDITLVVWNKGIPMAMGPSLNVPIIQQDDSRVVVVTSGSIANGVITTDHISTSGISADVIKTGTLDASIVNVINLNANNITAGNISASIISGGTLNAGSINVINLSGSSIVAGSITGDKIAASTISGNNIAANTITGANIAASTITGNNIAFNTISGNHIAASTISGGNIMASTITGAHIAAGSITGANIAANTISGNLIAANTISGDNLVVGTITSTQIAASTILGSNIAAATISGGNIMAGTITGQNIAANTITGSNIAASTISGGNIMAGTITGQNIAANTITGGHLVIGTITGQYIASSTISGDKIMAATISGGNIMSNTITASNIASSSITGDKIAASTITGYNIAAGTISGNNIAARTISGGNIQANTITSDLIAATGLSGNVIKGGVITLTTGMTINGASGTTFIDSQGIWANSIYAGTLDASKITVTNLRADSIVAGSLTLNPTNMLLNSSFESSPGSIPLYWQVLNPDPALAVHVDTTTGYYTGSSIKINTVGTPTQNYSGFAYGSPIQLIAGNKYVMSARVKTQNVTGTLFTRQIYFQLYVNGLYSSDFYLTCPSGTSNWTWVTNTLDLTEYAPGTSLILQPTAPGLGTDASGIIWIDGVMLQRGTIATDWVPAPQEQIPSGSIVGTQIASGTITDSNIVSLTASKLTAGIINTGQIIIANASGTTFIDGNNIYTDRIVLLGSGGMTVISGGIINASAIQAGQLNASLISAGTITADRFVSTLWGDMSQAIQYVKNQLVNPIYSYTFSQTDYINGVPTNIDTSTSQLLLAAQNRWDSGLTYDSGLTWDEPNVPSGNWISPVFDIGVLSVGFDQLSYNSSIPPGGSVTVNYRYSVDGVTWTDWAPFQQNVRVLRYYQFQFILQAPDTTHNVSVSNIKYTVFTNIKNDFGTVNISASGNTVINFAQQFQFNPSVHVTPISTSPCFAVVTALTPTQASVSLYNTSGQLISGTVSWTATGF